MLVFIEDWIKNDDMKVGRENQYVTTGLRKSTEDLGAETTNERTSSNN